ncbi:hypothetical protein GTO10_04555 [Candidatus Saccharibacteria bacterium]|nr:hypothetical protein [Candidatus Saccharibacteria bacterium]
MAESFQKVEVNPDQGESLLKKMPSAGGQLKPKGTLIPALIIIAIILAGAATGYFLANQGISMPQQVTELTGGVSIVQGPKEAGIKDETLFPDTAQGKVKVNDSEEITEGSHKLIRAGGESQTAFLTSSVLDLNQFLGKCVQVWGETFQAQKAGWFMDVGRIKVLDACPEGV